SRRRHTRLVSDWSSDVCSSDLWAKSVSQALWLQEVLRVAEEIAELKLASHSDLTGKRTLPNCRAAWKKPVHYVGGTGHESNPDQIGRASCRERVERCVDAEESR